MNIITIRLQKGDIDTLSFPPVHTLLGMFEQISRNDTIYHQSVHEYVNSVSLGYFNVKVNFTS